MSTRVPATIAVLTLLALAAENPVAAQPVAPVRPRSNAFQNLFFPNSPAVPNAGFRGMGFNQGGQLGAGGNQLGAIGQPLLLQGPDGKTAPYLMIPLQSQPAVFGNYGHWYARNGYLGHWYPGGFQNGYGVLANSMGGGLGVGMGGAGGQGFGGGVGGGNVGPVVGGGMVGGAAPQPAFGLRVGGGRR